MIAQLREEAPGITTVDHSVIEGCRERHDEPLDREAIPKGHHRPGPARCDDRCSADWENRCPLLQPNCPHVVQRASRAGKVGRRDRPLLAAAARRRISVASCAVERW